MRIKIDKFWQNIKGVQVDAGEYEETDLPLGVARYLVENGHAVAVDAPVSEPEPEPVEDAVVTVSNEDTERESLIAEYEALTGESPAWNIGIDTLKARLEELRDS